MAKILVVDDQFGVRCMLFETFRQEQHEVELAENGAEALRLFIDFEPNLILMDMKMPGMNGIETLRKIRALDHGILHGPINLKKWEKSGKPAPCLG